jgi:DNA-binding MarR family transcriptional regulator
MDMNNLETLKQAKFIWARAIMMLKQVCEDIAPATEGPLTDCQVSFIREVYPTGIYTQRELATKFKVSPSYISEIITRKKKVRENVTSR